MFIKHLSYTRDLTSAYNYLRYVHAVNRDGYYDLTRDTAGVPYLRDQCMMTYIDASGHQNNPELWSSDCVAELMQYGKHLEVMTHAYILSWPESDYAKVTLSDLVDIGADVTHNYFAGHHVLVAAHGDKPHPHVHIVVFNMRAAEREAAPWMLTGVSGEVLPSEVAAGAMHHHTPAFEEALYDHVWSLSKRYGLDETDFRTVMAKNRNIWLAERQKDLKVALGSIQCDYYDGLSMNELAVQLNLRCGARLYAAKDNTLKIRFGEKGKGYPLEKWDITPEDIDRTIRPHRYRTDIRPMRRDDWITLPSTEEQTLTIKVLAEKCADLDARYKELFDYYQAIADGDVRIGEYRRICGEVSTVFWEEYRRIRREQPGGYHKVYYGDYGRFLKLIDTVEEAVKQAVQAIGTTMVMIVVADTFLGPVLAVAAVLCLFIDFAQGLEACDVMDTEDVPVPRIREMHELAEQMTDWTLPLAERYDLLMELQGHCCTRDITSGVRRTLKTKTESRPKER